jgi:two-component system nitrate/nitrite response regulator NarL
MATTQARELSICMVGGTNLFRLAFRSLLEEIHVRVVEEFEAVEKIPSADDTYPQEFQLVVYNASFYSEEVTEHLAALKERFRDKPIILISEVIRPHFLQACIATGISGYVSQSDSPEILRHSLWLAALGQMVLPSNLSDLGSVWSAGSYIAHSNNDLPVQHLSEREREILACLVAGNSNKAIARQLGITEATVKVHMKNLLRKVDADNRTQAALWALRNKVMLIATGLVPNLLMLGH